MIRDAFASFLTEIVARKCNAQVSREWCKSDSTIRGWCKNLASPTIRELLALLPRMSDEEFIGLMRLMAGERADVQLRDQSRIDPSAGEFELMTVCGEVVTLAAELSVEELKAIADGKIDPSEQAIIDRRVDCLKQRADQCRPALFPRLLVRIRTTITRRTRLFALAR